MRLAPLALIAVVLGSGALAAGCQSASDAAAGEPIPPSFEPVVVSRRPTSNDPRLDRERRPVAEDEAGWERKWEVASRWSRGGYDDEALRLIAAALADEPPAPWRQRLNALRTSIRVRRAEEEVLRAEARPLRDYVTFGQGVRFRVRLRNVSGQPIRIVAGERGVSPPLISLEVTRTDRDIYASELRRSFLRTVRLLPPDRAFAVIAPGGLLDVPATVPPAEAGGRIAGLHLLEVGGTLRLPHLVVGEEVRKIDLPIRSGRAVVLPAGYEPIAEAPVASVERAIDAVAPIHLLIGVELAPPADDPALCRHLARAIGEGDPALQRAALGGLRTIRERSVGQPLVPLAAPLIAGLDRWPDRAEPLAEALTTVTGEVYRDARLWRDWWRRKAKEAVVAAPARAEPGP